MMNANKWKPVGPSTSEPQVFSNLTAGLQSTLDRHRDKSRPLLGWHFPIGFVIFIVISTD